MQRSKLALVALGLSAPFLASAQTTATEISTMVGDSEALLQAVAPTMLLMGTVVIGLAAIGAGIKWVKATFFS